MKGRLTNILTNINRLCPRVKDLNKTLNLDRNIVNNKFNDTCIRPNIKEEINSKMCKDFFSIQKELNWIYPSHICPKYVKNMVNLGGNEFGMKTALLVGDEKNGALIRNNDFEIGYVYFEPNWFYPPHIHKTEEVYYILHGTAEFGKEEDDSIKYEIVKPKDMVYHHSYQPHAMKFGSVYVLSIYIWYRKGKYYFIK
jgi:mannose-6-phosphate isomerase-like protein (cupin superfamily)